MRVLAVAVLCVLFFPVHAQKVDKYLFLGREAEEAKDYYKAAEIYREGAAVTVTNAKLNFHYAEVLRLLNEYELSQKYYQLTLAIDSLNEYPVSLYWIAMMQKNNGNYKESLGNWELLKRLYSSDPSSDIYRKAVQETEVCAAILKGGIPTYPNKIWNLETLNTINAEFAASYYDSTGLIFSSLEKAGKERDKKEKFIELHAAIRDQGKWNESALLPAQINATGFQNANGSFSSDKKYFVFTRCDQPATCMIYIAIYRNGAYSEAYPLKVNLPGYNTTQPCLVKTDNGYVLFFSSDRPGGSGGLDIWYALADEKLNIGEPMNCPGVNSTEDDITPFYFHPTKELFFSSTWFGGMGGMDIFKSATDLSSFDAPNNIGLPYNSPANDSYFTINDRGYRGLLTSNREGSESSFGKTCCNDIYEFEYPVWLIESAPSVSLPPPAPIAVTTGRIKDLYEQLSSLLPLTLYFHNDEPDPRSVRNYTLLNYQDCYLDYFAVKGRYDETDPAQSARIYTELVQRGFDKLERYTEIAAELMKLGAALELDVRGFASPLAKSDYNVNLTSRRIESFRNYLKQYHNGELLPYLVATGNQSQLKIRRLPFGENKSAAGVSDDYYKQELSVYSYPAARERRIEIVATRLIEPAKSTVGAAALSNTGTKKPVTTGNSGTKPTVSTAEQTLADNLPIESVLPSEVRTPVKSQAKPATDTKSVVKNTVTVPESNPSDVVTNPVLVTETPKTKTVRLTETPIVPEKEARIITPPASTAPSATDTKADPVYLSNVISLNLGKVRRGPLLVKKIKFRNAFGQNINFTKIITDCGCTSLKVMTKMLVPEEETEFVLLFETRGKVGVQEGVATIMTRDLKDNITIRFKVEVMP